MCAVARQTNWPTYWLACYWAALGRQRRLCSASLGHLPTISLSVCVCMCLSVCVSVCLCVYVRLSVFVVPMDLDVRMKATLLGAVFLIVSCSQFTLVCPSVCLSCQLLWGDCVHAVITCVCYIIIKLLSCEMFQLCVRLHSYSSEVKFVQERGVARLWEVARFNFLLPRN